jgi:hypothetical protein
MRALEQIHLDELESSEGIALNLGLGYARRLARVAANRYGRTFGVFEDGDAFSVSSKYRDDPLYEAFKPDSSEDAEVAGLALGYGYMRTPSESPVEWNPETDVPEGNRPKHRPQIRAGDRINYLAPGSSGMWDGSVVTGVVKKQPFKGQLYVTAPNGELGIISRGMCELASPVKIGEVNVSGEAPQDIMQAAGGGVPYTVPSVEILGEQLERRGPDRRDGEERRLASRSTDYVLVGTYEVVTEGETFRYKRLQYTSVKAETVSTTELTNQLTDALNTVAFMEHDLEPGSVLSIVRADAWEEENEEVLI